MADDGKTYRFETDAETLNSINATEAKFGMTHEEFVKKAVDFIDTRESEFRRHSRGESR